MVVVVFNDGTQKELVKMEGTIPVLYKGESSPKGLLSDVCQT